MPSAPPMSCLKVLRSQVKVCIDWMIVSLEEIECVMLTAFSFQPVSLPSFVANMLLIMLTKATHQRRWGLPCSPAQNGGHRG